MNRLVIVGAGGHGKVIADNALRNGYKDIFFVDNYLKGECMGFEIIGTHADIEALDTGTTDFVIGIGNNDSRKLIAEKYNVNWVSIIHPSAQIATNVAIGLGTVVMAGAVVNACAKIGEHCIINTCAIIEHDDIIENYVHISPRAAVGGTVNIGESTHIGIGAVVKNNIDICSDCIIGAGAVVVRDIKEKGIYVGVPERKIK